MWCNGGSSLGGEGRGGEGCAFLLHLFGLVSSSVVQSTLLPSVLELLCGTMFCIASVNSAPDTAWALP
jgi:hypothetical protein